MSERRVIGMQEPELPDSPNGDLGLARMVARVYEQNVEAGWWSDLETGKPIERDKGQLLMLIVTELAEAAEGARKSYKTPKMDDKLPNRPMEEVEMADTLIRCLDFCGGFNYTLRYRKMPIGLRQTEDKLGNLLYLVDKACAINYCELLRDRKAAERAMSRLVCGIVEYCNVYELDLMGAYYEKLEYNKTRADHKVEARKADGGKSI